MTQRTSSAVAAAERAPVGVGAVLVVIVALALVPIWTGGYPLYLATEAVTLGLAAVALGLLAGHTGIISLGQAGFFGIGAYALGLVVKSGGSIWVGLLLAIVCAALYAGVTGPLILRGHGVVVLMTTVAFAQLVYSVAYKWGWLTGGDDGLPLPRLGVSPPALYVGSAIVLVVTVLALRRLIQSPFGQALEAIRQNETKARALGIPAFQYKLAVYVLTAGLTGLAGGLSAIHRTFVSPHDLYWVTSATLLVMVLLGGSRGFFGPVLGATLYVFLQAWVSSMTELWLFFLGLVLVLTVLWTQDGLWGLISKRWPRR